MPTRSRSTAPVLLASVGVVLSLLVAGCGGDDDSATSEDTTQSTDDTTSGAAEGTIVAQDFSLSDVTVGPGDEIVLQNQGSATHTATADGGEFDLGAVGAGETSEPGTAPTEPGTYPFHCEIHASMTATLTVEG